MFKILFLLMAWLPLADQNISQQEATCTCSSVTNLYKSGQTDNSYTISWNSQTEANGYNLFYTRQEGGFTSAVYSTTSPTHTFYGLPNGHYDFFVSAVCGTESSGFVGVEDIIEN
ncbi:MAG: fibronectin type III domain-containing protein [Saprospiraceae bacterium]